MWTTWCKLFICFYPVMLSGQTQDEYKLLETTTVSILANGEKRMSEYMLDVLKHFQNPDPMGLPGVAVPEPMLIPDTRKSFGFTTLLFKNTAVHGISQFRMLNINAEISSMKITGNMTMDNLEAKGICVASTFWSSVRSPFSVKLREINVTGLATLGVSRDGKLAVEDISMKMSFDSVAMKFEDAGAFGIVISSLVSTAGNFIFDTIKPFILNEAYTKLREEMNSKLDSLTGDLQYPNTISPLDMVLIDVRKKVRAMNMDPYKIDDYNTTMGLFSIGLYETYITGVSSFKRVGNITMTLENSTVIADFEIGTEQLEGVAHWELSAVNGMLSRTGSISFSVKYINGRIILAQPVNITKKPFLQDLKLDIGNLQIRSDGAGTIDYVIECAVNILPNLLRYQILSVLENPIKWKIQKELDEFNIEEVIEQELPKMDDFMEKEFKLSELRAITEEVEEDDFFNF